MEDLGINPQFWEGRSVFLTGHTGFKGGWLALWLSDLGAEVHGYSLPPPTQPSFFIEAGLRDRLVSSEAGDIRDFSALSAAMRRAEPSVVIHMAAQSLVRESYLKPMQTIDVNVMGAVNLMESARQTKTVRGILNVTSDKCYENTGLSRVFKETDTLGGTDLYSCSKACAELVTSAYRDSFLSGSGMKLASARAGNVIGGGDWATDRLVPDFLSALETGEVLIIRSPEATRPWQHVLEPLSGYLRLAEKLVTSGTQFAEAWNFGPNIGDSRRVTEVLDYLCAKRPEVSWIAEGLQQPYEAPSLQLSSVKANEMLGWSPRWSLETALDMTLAWFTHWKEGMDMHQVSLAQIKSFAAS